MAGIALIGMGLYFIFVRSPLLPEDLRFMRLTVGQTQTFEPGLTAWLTQVFRVLGGYIIATGVLAITLAATSFRAHRWGAAVGTFLGGAASIGWMTAVNFAIASDFKWALLAIALVWVSSLLLFCVEKNSTAQLRREQE
jgi:RsiW-degrading membrane proteinase PrsW (M82 family)